MGAPFAKIRTVGGRLAEISITGLHIAMQCSKVWLKVWAEAILKLSWLNLASSRRDDYKNAFTVHMWAAGISGLRAVVISSSDVQRASSVPAVPQVWMCD